MTGRGCHTRWHRWPGHSARWPPLTRGLAPAAARFAERGRVRSGCLGAQRGRLGQREGPRWGWGLHGSVNMCNSPQRHAWKRLKGAVSFTAVKHLKGWRRPLSPGEAWTLSSASAAPRARGLARQLGTCRPCAWPARIPVQSPGPRPKHSGSCLGASSPLCQSSFPKRPGPLHSEWASSTTPLP